MENYQILVLLTCHENKDSIKDTVDNIFKFNEHVCVVINDGTSEGLDDLVREHVHIVKRKILTKDISHNDVSVSFERFDTMVPLHLDLKDYIVENKLSSEYVLLMSSNQLFINRGLFNFMKDYDASFFDRPVDNGCINSLMANKFFSKYYEELGKDNFIHQSNHDGMFFKYDIFVEMMDYLVDIQNSKIHNHAEEFLYVAYLKKHNKTLAEYGKYNYWQGSWRHNIIPINVEEIKSCIDRGFFLAKRISRNFNDPTRSYIKELT
jgi:hypothetical protein